MTTLQSVSRILRPPPRPLEATITAAHWAALARALGAEFPTDFRRFVEAYGTGTISRFIAIANPFSEADPFFPWFMSVLAADKNCLLHTGSGVAGGLPPFPAPGGLLPFGRWADWGVLYFQTRGVPDGWPIVFTDVHGNDHGSFDMSLFTFLEQVLRGKLRSPIFGVEYPRHEKAKFVPGATR